MPHDKYHFGEVEDSAHHCEGDTEGLIHKAGRNSHTPYDPLTLPKVRPRPEVWDKRGKGIFGVARVQSPVPATVAKVAGCITEKPERRCLQGPETPQMCEEMALDRQRAGFSERPGRTTNRAAL